MRPLRHDLAVAAGLLAGGVAVPGGLALASFPRGEGRLGLGVQVSLMPSGEIGARTGVLAAHADLRPGGTVRGARVVRNQTGRTLVVRVRALPSSRDADRTLRVRVHVDGLPVAEGTLGDLRRWSARWFQLRRGERRRLDVRVALAPPRGARWRGVLEDVSLELQARPRSRS